MLCRCLPQPPPADLQFTAIHGRCIKDLDWELGKRTRASARPSRQTRPSMAGKHEVCGCAVRVYAAYACQYDTGCDLSRAKAPLVFSAVRGRTNPSAVTENYLEIFPEDVHQFPANRLGPINFGQSMVKRAGACARLDKAALNELLSIGVQVETALAAGAVDWRTCHTFSSCKSCAALATDDRSRALLAELAPRKAGRPAKRPRGWQASSAPPRAPMPTAAAGAAASPTPSPSVGGSACHGGMPPSVPGLAGVSGAGDGGLRVARPCRVAVGRGT